MVCFFISLLLTSVLKSPLIFFRLAENAVGENDLLLTPGFSVEKTVVLQANINGLPLLNHSWFNASLQDTGGVVSGSLPRWALISQLQNTADASQQATALILSFDSELENQLGFGREWEFGTLEQGEAVISRTILRQIGMDPAFSAGANVTVVFDIFELSNTLGLTNINTTGGTSEQQLEQLITALSPNATESALFNDVIPFVDIFAAAGFNLSDPLGTLASAGLNTSNITDGSLNVSVIATFLRDFVQDFTNTTLNATLPETLNLPQNLTDSFNQFINEAVLNNTFDPTLGIRLGDLLGITFPAIGSSLSTSFVMRIKGVSDSANGKWPASLGSVVAMDTATLFDQLRTTARNALDITVNISTIRRDILGATGTDIIPSNITGISVAQRQDIVAALEGGDLFPNEAQLREAVDTFNEQDYVLQSIVQYSGRLKTYLKDIQSMERDILGFSDVVAQKIGVTYRATFTAPIALQLKQTQFIRYFLDNIFGSVIALIVMLGVLLIYSLLLNDVEERTYEYGMLRALGMKQTTLVQILATKALTFAVPGIALALFIAFLCNIPIAQLIADFSAVGVDYNLSPVAISVAVSVGLIMPLVSNILPISRALSSTLRDSLDVYHQVVSDVKVTIVKLASLGLDLWQTVLAVLLIVVGFVVFYLVPYSFTFRKFAMFLAILNSILLGMLLGLCLLATIVQPYLERLMIHLIIWGPHRRLKKLVAKNLAGHRLRNQKTASMFTIALAFVLFGGTMFTLMANSISDTVRNFAGSDVIIFAPNLANALDEARMSTYLERERERTLRGEPAAIVQGFTFATFPIRTIPTVSRARLANLPYFPSVRNFVYGLQANFLDVAYSDYYIATSVSGPAPLTPTGDQDAIRLMFSEAGQAKLPLEEGGSLGPPSTVSGTWLPWTLTNDSISDFDASYAVSEQAEDEKRAKNYREAYRDYVDVVISEALRDYASISIDTPLTLNLRFETAAGTVTRRDFLCKARGMASKVPGFLFSTYRSTAFFSSVLIREDQYAKFVREAYALDPTQSTTDYAPKQRLFIKLTPGASEDEREDVINGLRTFFKSDLTATVDTQDIVDSTNTSVSLLNLFFTMVGMVAMILCFFILFLSFTANVRENAWEFGVLRAVGVNAVQAVMIYVYESLALVLSSLLLGTLIGIVIAISLTLQFNLFVEQKFRFEFPHLLFWSMAAMSILVAVCGSGIPAHSFLNKTISTVLRRQ